MALPDACTADEAQITHDMQLIADALPEDTLFNFSALTAFSEDDPEAACSIIRTFIEETGKNADRMQQALTDREVDGKDYVGDFGGGA